MNIQNILRGVYTGLSGLSFLLCLCVAMTSAVLHCVAVECMARVRGLRRKNTGPTRDNTPCFLHKLSSHG